MIKSLEEKIAKVSSELESMATKLSEAEKASEASSQNDKKKIENLKAQVNEYESEKNEALAKMFDGEDTIKSLSSKLKDANESLNIVKGMLNERDVEIDERRKEIETVRASQSELEDKSKRLVVLLNKTKKQILKLEREKTDGVEEAESNKAQLDKALGQVSELTKNETGLKAEISRLNAKIQNTEGDIKILQKERREALEQKDQMFDELQIKQAEFESSQSNADNLQHRLKESERQVEEAEEKASACEEYQMMAEEAKKDLRDHEKMWNDQRRRLEQSIEEKDEALAKIKVDHEHIEEELKSKVEKITERLTTLEKDAEHTHEELETRTREVHVLESDKSGLLERIDMLEADLAKNEGEAQSVSGELELLRKKSDELTSTRDRLAKDLEDITMRENHLKTLNRSLKDEIRKLSRTPIATNTRPSSSHPTSPSPYSTSDHRSLRSGASTPPGPDSFGSSPPSTPRNKEEEINVEYLRNVIIKFLEKKSTRVSGFI
ncbi:hypothetical protein CLU79DRAFT_594415 [Phycomyces nitens]|nr:hypothetical protein CLU79DRAFT_594415 [Phycomyces nitens]